MACNTVPATECYSPTQNLEFAYEPDAVGCSCDDEPGQCIDGVALICDGSRWQAVVDGPCAPAFDPCSDGEIVESSDGCLQDDAFCRELPDGRYCTGAQAPSCPAGSEPIAKDAQCPTDTRCFDYSESLRCATHAYTQQACSAASGVALSDPGDGSLLRDGCPSGAQPLGFIDDNWDEGGLCCPAAEGCTAQQVELIGSCEPAPRYYWNGRTCVGLTGCRCEGTDCDAGYASEDACMQGFRSCSTAVACGARAGATCNDAEYCAYVEGEYCGAADAEALCKRRPVACAADLAPVCGCDGKTYDNACTANMAGSGVVSNGSCQ